MKRLYLGRKFSTTNEDDFRADYAQFEQVLRIHGREPKPAEDYLNAGNYPLFMKAWKAGKFKIQ